MIFILLILTGLVVGSFANNIISVYVCGAKLDIWRSRCAHCGHTLKTNDIIPVLSYLTLGRKCRYCSAVISIRYIIVELISALLFLLSFIKWGITLDAFIHFVVHYLFLIIIVIDYSVLIIPNRLLIPIGFIAVYQSFVTGDFVNYFYAIVITSVFMLINNVYRKTRGIKAIGEGDIKFIALLTILFGALSFLGLWLSAALALPGFLLIKKLDEERNEENRIPFGVFIAIAYFLVDVSGIDMETILEIGMKLYV